MAKIEIRFTWGNKRYECILITSRKDAKLAEREYQILFFASLASLREMSSGNKCYFCFVMKNIPYETRQENKS